MTEARRLALRRYQQAYERSAKGRATMRRYRQTAKGKAASRRSNTKRVCVATRKIYAESAARAEMLRAHIQRRRNEFKERQCHSRVTHAQSGS
jgi:hypothetical protein